MPSEQWFQVTTFAMVFVALITPFQARARSICGCGCWIQLWSSRDHNVASSRCMDRSMLRCSWPWGFAVQCLRASRPWALKAPDPLAPWSHDGSPLMPFCRSASSRYNGTCCWLSVCVPLAEEHSFYVLAGQLQGHPCLMWMVYFLSKPRRGATMPTTSCNERAYFLRLLTVCT